jgi:hypothetical protein
VIADKAAAQRLLAGIENGTLSTADAVMVAEGLDPVLFYAIVSFLRANYPASDPAATSVLERVVRLTRGSAVLVRHHRDGGADPVSRWFESEHGYAAFRKRGNEMIALVADKLDS